MLNSTLQHARTALSVPSIRAASAALLLTAVVIFAGLPPARAVPGAPVPADTYSFDFQPAGAPVQAGYTEANPAMGYTPQRGFGFADVSVLDSRDRGEVNTNLLRDFVISDSFIEFQLDVPNGVYSVTTYHGDSLGTARSGINLEDRYYGRVTSGKGSWETKLVDQVWVRDGQLNVYVSGTSHRLNGLDVTPLRFDFQPAGTPVEAGYTEVNPTMGYTSGRGFGFADASVLDDRDRGSSSSRLLRDFVISSSQFEFRVDVPNGLYALKTHHGDAIASTETNISVEGQDYGRVTTRPGDFVEKPIGPVQVTGGQLNMTISGSSHRLNGLEVTPVNRRVMERLDRAPVAVMADGGVRLSWRMLGLGPDSIGFHVIRDGQQITTEPVTSSTTWFDPGGTPQSRYAVKVAGSGESTAEVTPLTTNYHSVPLDKPDDGVTKDGQRYSYSAGDASVADLDGDGQYEIIQMWSPSNAKDNSQGGFTGLVYIDAYELDGTRLWRINMGPNIRAGAHYTQLLAYDFNGDGKAEVAMKTADGTRDGDGTVIGDPNADHRNNYGYILSGPEYLTVFHGDTGTVMDTVPYYPPRGNVSDWGDDYGNRVDRFLAAVAYLDGEHPSMMFSRGYYTRTVLAAYDLVGERIVRKWVFDSDVAGEQYEGQGNHNLSVADVDGDTKDEFVFGSMTIDDDGTPLYNTGLGHGDAIHTSDFDPSRPGLETFAAHEDLWSSGGLGATFRDAGSGQVLWSIPADRDTGRAAAGDVDPRYPGAEGWASGSSGPEMRSSSGELISDTIPAANFLAWWDGDLLREIVNHDSSVPIVSKWNWEAGWSDWLLEAPGATTINGTKATPAIQADLMGDWREEIAWPSADSTELRIFVPTAPTEVRLRTLMHDSQYRTGVARQNVSYNQPPHTSFFIGAGMQAPEQPYIRYAG